MSKNRRFTVVLSGLLLVATVVALFGLPFASFSVTSINAQYNNEAGTCGFTPYSQVRLIGGGVNVYTSGELTQVAAIVPDSDRQKYLLCSDTDTRPDGYLAIFFPVNKKFYVRAEDVADVVCRDLTDSETGSC